MSGGTGRRSPLDHPVARLIAVGVALSGLAFLAGVFWGALFAPEPTIVFTDPADTAYFACVKPRSEEFAAALQHGELTEEQAALFLRRAQAFCADQAQKGHLPAGPSMPGQ